MHSLRRLTSAVAAGLLVLGVVATPSSVAAKPVPGTPTRGFRLFARSLGALTINRIYCGLAAVGNICTDSTNSSTIGGGFWPKGTADQYVFNSGLQIAGIIQGGAENPWASDTAGAFLFNARGGGNGEEVQSVFNSAAAADAAAWPAAAKVPATSLNHSLVGSPVLFNELLRSKLAASQGDVWWLTWDGNPDQNASRTHPLGIVVEQRGMGWNFPAGNEDIIYFTYTFYNITSTNPLDYAEVRPDLQPILLAQAQQFQTRNNAKFGITLPAAGYTIGPLFAAFGADMDVANAGVNYSSVNLPFALGYAYEHTFGQPQDWTFDPRIFNQPGLFPGVGFVGVKYLASPTGPGEIQLFSNTTNGGAFPDPQSVQSLYRMLAGTLLPSDGTCNNANAAGAPPSHVCFVNTTQSDVRFFQSSTALTLAPGQFGSIVVAYIFAAPTAVASFTPSAGADVKPGNPRILTNLAQVTAGANLIDSLTGYKGYSDLAVNGGNEDGIVQQGEFRTQPGSLLQKASVAQAVFDKRFLLPFAPEPPNFFLIPGDNQVTVVWQPSPSESTGDPYFAVAQAVTTTDQLGNVVANVLYDPNYRQLDVEGYRVYRGRVDSPNSLALVAQFDYAGTTMKDFAAQLVVPGGAAPDGCAPELAITTSCPGTFDEPFPAPGSINQSRTLFVDVPLVGQVLQVPLGGRAALANGSALITKADTALTGGASGFPPLADTGIPFAFVDHGVRNNFRYFYAVTAFDVNSIQSSPGNLESARITKAITPAVEGSNFSSTSQATFTFTGRGPVTDSTDATIDPTTGVFSKKAGFANGSSLSLLAVVSKILAQGGEVTAHLDSLQLGDPFLDGTPHNYYVTIASPESPTHQVVVSLVQNVHPGDPVSNITLFPGVRADAALASTYGGNNNYVLPAKFEFILTGAYYMGVYGRGCVNGGSVPGFGGTPANCSYNGARWFDGPSPAKNEVTADPNFNANSNNAPAVLTDYNNAGKLTGVSTIHEVKSYQTVNSAWRAVEYVMAGAARAADFNVYWGAAGKVDSVIDVSNDVVVPFAADKIGATWGILNQNATTGVGSFDTKPGVLTASDMACVSSVLANNGFQAIIHCTAATPYALSNTAVPGPTGLFSGSVAAAKAAVAAADAGFVFYLPGHIFTITLTGGVLPAAGTVWTMRSYIGAIRGGNGNVGNKGIYRFTPQKRSWTAVGSSYTYSFTVANTFVATVDSGLSRVHTVPDPYYVTNEFESTTDTKIIRFVNLPSKCLIRIYSSSGVLVNMLEHNSNTFGGSEVWNVRNRNNQVVASGVYFYHIEAGDARKVGRFTVVNFAQ